jgi:hypothetical protein
MGGDRSRSWLLAEVACAPSKGERAWYRPNSPEKLIGIRFRSEATNAAGTGTLKPPSVPNIAVIFRGRRHPATQGPSQSGWPLRSWRTPAVWLL